MTARFIRVLCFLPLCATYGPARPVLLVGPPKINQATLATEIDAAT